MVTFPEAGMLGTFTQKIEFPPETLQLSVQKLISSPIEFVNLTSLHVELILFPLNSSVRLVIIPS
jgi:hypothetical protein